MSLGSAAELVQTSSSTGGASEKVPVSFVCSSACAFVVSERPILVPVSSTPSELSDLVRHLLSAEGEDVPEDARFDFLFEVAEESKVLLRGPLQKILLEAGWTLERTVRLEYFQSSPEPQLQETIEHPDWIRCLASQGGIFASGCYDGVVRVFSRSNSAAAAASEAIAEVPAHELAVTALSFIPSASAGARFVSASLDQSGRAFHQLPSAASVDGGRFDESFVLALPEDEQEPLACVAVSKRGDLLAVAGAAGKISVFSARREEPGEESFSALPPQSATAEPAKKRSRRAQPAETASQPRRRRARHVLDGAHSAPITALLFDRCEYRDTGLPLLFSASLDGSIRAWDLRERSFAFILSGEQPITALVQHPTNAKCLVSAHVDGSLRFWNISEPLLGSSALLPTTYFAGNPEIVTKRLKQLHRGWITAVAWSPRSEHLFATAGHDGAVKIWDSRCPTNTAPVPQFTLRDGNGLRDGDGTKVLALDWAVDGFLRFGGEDCRVHCYSTTNHH